MRILTSLVVSLFFVTSSFAGSDSIQIKIRGELFVNSDVAGYKSLMLRGTVVNEEDLDDDLRISLNHYAIFALANNHRFRSLHSCPRGDFVLDGPKESFFRGEHRLGLPRLVSARCYKR